MGVHLGTDQIHVAGQQVLMGGDAGVVDQQVDIGRGISGSAGGVRIGDVETQGRDPRDVDLLRSAGGGVDLGTPLDELTGELATEPTVGAGDESSGIGDLHAVHGRI